MEFQKLELGAASFDFDVVEQEGHHYRNLHLDITVPVIVSEVKLTELAILFLGGLKERLERDKAREN